jgi:hypothetical protein
MLQVHRRQRVRRRTRTSASREDGPGDQESDETPSGHAWIVRPSSGTLCEPLDQVPPVGSEVDGADSMQFAGAVLHASGSAPAAPELTPARPLGDIVKQP